MIYYTADQHFGHANIIKHCNRPFASVEEMDDYMLARWNERVTDEDTVYIVGDLFFRNKVPCEEYLRQLRGEKYLIIGNHDKSWLRGVDLDAHFARVTHFMELRDGSREVTLCHYPLMTWDGVARGAYHIYGHIHNNVNSPYFSLLRGMDMALNAGAEINDYRPATLEELVENNRSFKAQLAL